MLNLKSTIQNKVLNLLGVFNKKEVACEAPFQSMRFNHSGNVIACCFNRGNILGKFPDQSIEEIWFGNNVKNLQKAIKNDDFSLGCHSCEKNIKCGNRAATGASQYDSLKNYKQHKNYPTMFDFELGSKCNFECIMCSGEYSSAIRLNREKNEPYFSPYEENPELFLEQLTPFLPHLEEMRFIGGEPFLMKVHYYIWDKVLEVNPDIKLNVLTNASILNQRVKSLLEKGNFKISVSIDSLEKETFESIRKNGNFDTVMKNILFFKKIMDERGHTMNFNLCVMRQNWQEIPQYFKYCNENNIKVILHTVRFPAHCSIWNLPLVEIEEIVNYFKQNTIEEENSEISRENKETYDGLTNQIDSWYKGKVVQQEHSEKKETILLRKDFFIKFNEKLTQYKTPVKGTEYEKEISNLLDKFNHPEQEKIIEYLEGVGIDFILDEINISTEDRLLERFKTLAKF